MQDPAAVAQQAVRDELDHVDRARTPQHPPCEDMPPRLRDHPHLPLVLVLRLARCALHRDCRRLVDRSLPVLHHQVREAEVVAEARVVLDVVVPPHRVDRAVAAGLRFVRAQPELVAPVEALLVRAGRIA